MFMNKFLTCSKKTAELLRLLTLPYQIGFVQSHSHLTEQQVLQIRQVLDSNDVEGIVKDYEQRMANLIGPGYGISFAAGRMAFFSLLKILNIGTGDEVILPGFTCSVMPNAIWRTGATPVFADIDIETFGSDAKAIEKKITSRTKLIVAQHSFGIPCNIQEIKELCERHGIFLMEDCAISLDSSVHGIKVGNWGDAAIFSTDHTKPLNTLIGGFFYTKNKSLYEKAEKLSTDMPQLDKVHQKRLFGQFLFERKNYNPSNYPRSILINYVRSRLTRLDFRQNAYTFLEADYKRQNSPGASYPYPAKMPPFLAQLGIYELNRWRSEKQGRKNLLDGYISIMAQSSFSRYLPKAYLNPDLEIVPLRFVFRYPDSEILMREMATFIDVRGTWFQQPIICCSDGLESLGYAYGSCRTAEKICMDIINWPCAVPQKWDDKILGIFKKIINDREVFA